jgi:hypothetical protein
MKPVGKTIQFYLPDGEPRGIRIAEITTRIVQAVAIPRALLGRARERPELDSVGVYLLLGDAVEGEKPFVYVGQSENPGKRLFQHMSDDKKAFWETAIVFVSRTNNFTQTHVRYLEYHCQIAAKEAGRYVLQNAVESEPFVPEPLKADLLDAFETMNILSSTLGHSVFQPMKHAKTEKGDEEEVFYCKGGGAEGRGEYVEGGFVVFAGSIARPDIVPSAVSSITPVRKRLTESGVLSESEGKLLFVEDYEFRSPSTAAMALTGRTENGWHAWKTKDGRTLDELKRLSTD